MKASPVKSEFFIVRIHLYVPYIIKIIFKNKLERENM